MECLLVSACMMIHFDSYVQIGKMEANLTSWKTETVQKRLDHPVLSFFSNFKVLHLYDLIVKGGQEPLSHELIGCMIFARGIDSEGTELVKKVSIKPNCDYLKVTSPTLLDRNRTDLFY